MECFGNSSEYFERMLADNSTGLLALANEYRKADRAEREDQQRVDGAALGEEA